MKAIILSDDVNIHDLASLCKQCNVECIKRCTEAREMFDVMRQSVCQCCLVAVSDNVLRQRITRQMYLLRPFIRLIVFVQNPETCDILEINKCGNAYILPFHKTINECADDLIEILKNEAIRSRVMQGNKSIPSIARTAVVTSAQGGVGKSTLICNYAVFLSQLGNHVALIDLDIAFGTVGYHFGLEHKQSISLLLEEDNLADYDDLRKYLIPHHTGVHILQSPSNPEQLESVDISKILLMLDSLRAHYDVILIDTPVGFTDINLAIMDYVEDIVVVAENTVPCIVTTRNFMNLCDALNFKNKLNLIMRNRFKHKTLDREIQKIFSSEACIHVTDLPKEMFEALNCGTPLLCNHRDQLWSVHCNTLAKKLNHLKNDSDNTKRRTRK